MTTATAPNAVGEVFAKALRAHLETEIDKLIEAEVTKVADKARARFKEEALAVMPRIFSTFRAEMMQTQLVISFEPAFDFKHK